MTFAEILLLVAVAAFLYYLVRPLQRRLEAYFQKLFHSKSKRKHRPIIDITDYSKKDKF